MCWQEGLPGPPEDPEGGAVPREDMSKACALLLGEEGAGWGSAGLENCGPGPAGTGLSVVGDAPSVSGYLRCPAQPAPPGASWSELTSASALRCA